LQLQAQDKREAKVTWYLINAAQMIEEVQAKINKIVEQMIAQVKDEGKPLQILWKNEEDCSK
jgi:hypothetical protein